MPDDICKMQRLFINHPLRDQNAIKLDKDQSHYLFNVMRYRQGTELLVFNGRDGEWCARIDAASKQAVTLFISRQIRTQPPARQLTYYFAPLKQARFDYVIQKAVELGVSKLCPVFTDHCQVTRVRETRMRANAIEAAEQCGILCVPDIEEPVALKTVLSGWSSNKALIFCDEQAPYDEANIIDTLRALTAKQVCVLIGPEGGFSSNEREYLQKMSCVISLSLGPRILRADTAAIAALALIQATIGDWVVPTPPQSDGNP